MYPNEFEILSKAYYEFVNELKKAISVPIIKFLDKILKKIGFGNEK